MRDGRKYAADDEVDRAQKLRLSVDDIPKTWTRPAESASDAPQLSSASFVRAALPESRTAQLAVLAVLALCTWGVVHLASTLEQPAPVEPASGAPAPAAKAAAAQPPATSSSLAPASAAAGEEPAPVVEGAPADDAAPAPAAPAVVAEGPEVGAVDGAGTALVEPVPEPRATPRKRRGPRPVEPAIPLPPDDEDDAFAELPARKEARALTRRAEALLRMDETERAKPLLERAAALDPTWPDVWRGLGIVRGRQNDHEGARLAYERYLRLAPTAVDAVEVRAVLER